MPEAHADPGFVDRILRLTERRDPQRAWRMERWAALLAAYWVPLNPRTGDWLRCAPEGARPQVQRDPVLLAACVKVTGTNGKGSVSAMLEASLGAAGHRVGLFTSPHLERITERIRLDGVEISAARFGHHLDRIESFVRAFLETHGERYTPSFFEVVLLVALDAFAASGVTLALFEAGVGGAHDPTSLLPGPLAVLTTVGFDHEGELGSTKVAIAGEKAGIARNCSTLVLGPAIEGEVRAAVEAAAGGVRLVPARRERVRVLAQDLSGSQVEVLTAGGEVAVAAHLPLLGDFQFDNLATVVAAVEALSALGLAPGLSCLAALEHTRWPARMEYLPGLPGSPAWLLDGAHNEEAIDHLTPMVRKYFANYRRILVFGTKGRKTYERYLARLGDLAPEIWLTADFEDAEDVAVLARGLAGRVRVEAPDLPLGELLETLLAGATGEPTLVVVTGSLYLVGTVRGWLVRRGLAGGAR